MYTRLTKEVCQSRKDRKAEMGKDGNRIKSALKSML